MAESAGLTAISTALVPNVLTPHAPDPPDGAGIDADEEAWRMGVQAEAEAQPLGSALIDAGLRLYSMLDGEWHNVYVEAYNERSGRHRVRCESSTILYRDVPASHDHCCPIMLSHHARCFPYLLQIPTARKCGICCATSDGCRPQNPKTDRSRRRELGLVARSGGGRAGPPARLLRGWRPDSLHRKRPGVTRTMMAVTMCSSHPMTMTITATRTTTSTEKHRRENERVKARGVLMPRRRVKEAPAPQRRAPAARHL